jgi:apoptosis-inducing factor 3
MVIVGVGVKCATDFLKDTPGIEVQRDGGVAVNEFLQTGADGVYAVGDIARYPYHITGENVRIEHWAVAEAQGRVAALNILGRAVAYRHIPFFWTVQYGKSIRYAGHALSFDEVFIQGDDDTFVAYYLKGEQVLAVATLGVDPVAAAAAELMHQGRMPNADAVRAGIDLRSLV